jgi:hypothetical protein
MEYLRTILELLRQWIVKTIAAAQEPIPSNSPADQQLPSQEAVPMSNDPCHLFRDALAQLVDVELPELLAELDRRMMALMECEMNQMAPMMAMMIDADGLPVNPPGLSRLQDRHSKIRSKMDTANKLIIEVAAIVKDQSK